jgi:hypothetical protein
MVVGRGLKEVVPWEEWDISKSMRMNRIAAFNFIKPFLVGSFLAGKARSNIG